MPFAQMSKGAMTSVVGLVADLADRDAVLARRLNLEPLELNLFRGRSPQSRWQRVFGGQVLGQALVAARTRGA